MCTISVQTWINSESLPNKVTHEEWGQQTKIKNTKKQRGHWHFPNDGSKKHEKAT